MGFIKKKFLVLTSLALVVGTFAVGGIKNTSEVEAAGSTITQTFKFGDHSDFSNWSSSYTAHTLEDDYLTVDFESANKQSNIITNMPVTKCKPVTFTLKEELRTSYYIQSFTINCKQWATKTQTISLQYTTDGTTYLDTGVESDNFSASYTYDLNNMIGGKINFSNSDNQIGIESITYTLIDLTSLDLTINESFANSETMMNLGFNYNLSGAPEMWTKINEVGELLVGDKIVITNIGGTKVLGGQNSNNRAAIDISLDGENYYTIIPDDAVILEVRDGIGIGTISLFDETNNGYLYASSSRKNYLKTQNTLDSNGSWVLNKDTDGFYFQARGTNSRNLLKYNSQSTLFSCYSSGQENINIYKLSGGATYNNFNSLTMKFKNEFNFSEYTDELANVTSGLIVTTDTDFTNTWNTTNSIEGLKALEGYKVFENTTLKDSFLVGINVSDEQLSEMKNTELYAVSYVSTENDACAEA